MTKSFLIGWNKFAVNLDEFANGHPWIFWFIIFSLVVELVVPFL